MSAYIVNRAHIDALVRLAVVGPRSERPIDPGTAWCGLYWYAADVRATVAGAVDHAEYSRKIEEIHRDARPETADRLAAVLVAQNVRSVRYRYPDGPASELPGPLDAYWTDLAALPRVALQGPRPSAVAGLKLIDCYEYQSCEDPGWEASEAHQFCDALRRRLIGNLPGYDEAAWEWTDEALAAVGW